MRQSRHEDKTFYPRTCNDVMTALRFEKIQLRRHFQENCVTFPPTLPRKQGTPTLVWNKLPQL
jgi:hypothetical protein